jgi:mono/diheme cytochrome c family protein
MKSHHLMLAGAGLIVVTGITGARAQQATSPSAQSGLDVRALFASNCGFCHSDGGRSAGRGPQLMETQRSDEFIRERIKNGKEGAMPAFGQMFSDSDINVIIKYIHELKPEGHG